MKPLEVSAGTNLSPTKVIIKRIAEALRTDELAVYRSCLASILDTRSCSFFLSSLDEKNISSYYKCNTPSEDPQFLTVENPRDLILLSRVTGVQLCVYQFSREKSQLPAKYVDTRPQCWSQGFKSSLAIAGEDGSEKKKIASFSFQRVSQNGRDYGDLVEMDSPVDEDSLMSSITEKVQPRVDGCALKALALLTADNSLVKDIQVASKRKKMSERSIVLGEKDEILRSLRETRGGAKSCIIVSVKGLKKLASLGKNGKSRHFLHPTKFHYMLLAQISDDSMPSVVVAPRNQGGWYVLDKNFSRHIAEIFTSSKSSPSVNQPHKRKRDSVIPEEFLHAKRLKHAGKNKASSGKSEREETETVDEKESDPEVFPCKCDVCEAS